MDEIFEYFWDEIVAHLVEFRHTVMQECGQALQPLVDMGLQGDDVIFHVNHATAGYGGRGAIRQIFSLN